MYTRDPGSTPWRRFLPPLLAVLLSIALLMTWMRVVSAQILHQENPSGNFDQKYNNQSFIGQEIQEISSNSINLPPPEPQAPTAPYDLAITKSKIPITFTERVEGSSKMTKAIVREAIKGVFQMKWKSFFAHYR